jgi:hypothetical protein
MFRRGALVVTLVLAACFEKHGANDLTIQQTDCYSCHKPDYDATGGSLYPAPVPMHSTQGCGTTCFECHTTSTWVNYLGGCNHPEQSFPLVSQGTQHNNINCTACHSDAISMATGATSVNGANTDCISCHLNDSTQQQNHTGALLYTSTTPPVAYVLYTGYSTTDHRFCLTCHPTGLAFVAHDSAVNPFRLPHNGAQCVQCHDYASNLGANNGDDVSCVNGQCHRNEANNPNHGNGMSFSGSGVHGLAGAPAPPSCIATGCHPTGGGG